MVEVILGDCLEVMRGMAENRVDAVVTSPPYWMARSYPLEPTTWQDGWVGQLGLEPHPDQYCRHLVEVFQQVRRVLRPRGAVWIVIDDTYAANRSYQVVASRHRDVGNFMGMKVPDGLKPKDLCLVPARLMLALQADGWWIRWDGIWDKPNAFTEHPHDRPERSHEYLILMSNARRYWFDESSIQEIGRTGKPRTRRSVWSINASPAYGAHIAAFPVDLASLLVRSVCPPGGTVLDPFGGSGTTAIAAMREGRNAVLIERVPEYVEIAKRRIAEERAKMAAQPGGLFASVV